MSRYNLDEEAAATDRQLAGLINKLGALTDEKILELLPKRADQDELNRLIEAVNEAADENRKKAVLSERLGAVSAVVKDVALALI
jgi:hypothetical protein